MDGKGGIYSYSLRISSYNLFIITILLTSPQKDVAFNQDMIDL